MNCYRKGGCGPYENRSCYECPASKPEYAERYLEEEMTNEQEERYVLTPKGIALVCLDHIGVELTDSQLNAFWILFEHYMKKNGYLVEGDE